MRTRLHAADILEYRLKQVFADGTVSMADLVAELKLQGAYPGSGQGQAANRNRQQERRA